MKIPIAYDGSDCADQAVNDLPRAGMPRCADALIVHIQEKIAEYKSAGNRYGVHFI